MDREKSRCGCRVRSGVNTGTERGTEAVQSADTTRLSGRTDEPLQALVSLTAEMVARGGSGRLKGMEAEEKEGRTGVSLALETMDGETGFSGARDSERQANEGEKARKACGIRCTTSLWGKELFSW